MEESRKTHSPISPTCTGKKTMPAPIAIPMLMMTQPTSVLSNFIAACHSLSDMPARAAAAEVCVGETEIVSITNSHSWCVGFIVLIQIDISKKQIITGLFTAFSWSVKIIARVKEKKLATLCPEKSDKEKFMP